MTTDLIVSSDLATKLYARVAAENTIHAAALSRIAQELGFMLQVPSPDVPGDVWAGLQRLHKDACDELDKARAIGSGP
jgi:hypothetical protein